MAEIAYGIAQKVLAHLGSRTFQKISSASGVQSDLKKLESTVLAIKAVLCDAVERQASDRKLRTWLADLKDVLNDAENVLDEFQYRVLQKEVMKRNGSTWKKVSYFFSGSNPLAFRFEMASKIKGIRERVDDIAAQKDKFGLAQGLEDRKTTMHRSDMTHSFVHPSSVIGRDDDKKHVIHHLMNPNDRKNVGVIPIVGIGGLGKTTLVKLVFNDEWVVSHFQLRMWVCVSEDFEIKILIKKILKSAIDKIDGENLIVNGLQNRLRELLKDERVIESLGLDELQFRLRKLLEDKKFLLVLDDVWNEDRNKWIELEDLLLGGCNESKIIVTTRNSRVAAIMGTVPAYKLDALSTDLCMSFFVKLAFKEGEENKYPNLLRIGKEIVEKCKGLPLAVKTLASLLYSKFDEGQWKFVRDNEIWKLKQNEGDILPALRLSYNQLPIHLKQCFAYCSLFPKDYKFNNVLLTQFWMAHGILQSPNIENQELEDVGDNFIKELFSRSFFQDIEEVIFGYSFKIHDLVHDLALSIAEAECSVVTKKSAFHAEVRHLSVLDNGPEITTKLERFSKVQTIIFQTEQPISLLEACILRFKYLRALDLNKSSFEVLPSSLGTLKHLRYLNLSFNHMIKKLPDSICKLYSLQTLLLRYCKNLERLPKGIRDMTSLECLVVSTKHTCLLEKEVDCLNTLRFLGIEAC